MTIIQQLQSIQTSLQNWAQDEGGIAVIASDLSHMWSQAYTRSDTPKVILCYMGEDIRGPAGTAAATHRVDRNFSACVTRGRGFDAIRGRPLTETTGNARPLFQLMEEARDTIRALLNISEEVPVDYKGVKTFSAGEIATDCYLIDFSVAADLPGLSATPDNMSAIPG